VSDWKISLQTKLLNGRTLSLDKGLCSRYVLIIRNALKDFTYIMRHLFGVIELPTEVEPDQLVSPDLPNGYETVAGWWATRETAALEMLSDPIATLFEDEEHLITIADKLEVLWKWVTAPPAFQAMGFKVSKAFPLDLLQQFYPLHP
jgi:hypothetical protein